MTKKSLVSFFASQSCPLTSTAILRDLLPPVNHLDVDEGISPAKATSFKKGEEVPVEVSEGALPRTLTEAKKTDKDKLLEFIWKRAAEDKVAFMREVKEVERRHESISAAKFAITRQMEAKQKRLHSSRKDEDDDQRQIRTLQHQIEEHEKRIDESKKILKGFDDEKKKVVSDKVRSLSGS